MNNCFLWIGGNQWDEHNHRKYSLKQSISHQIYLFKLLNKYQNIFYM